MAFAGSDRRHQAALLVIPAGYVDAGQFGAIANRGVGAITQFRFDAAAVLQPQAPAFFAKLHTGDRGGQSSVALGKVSKQIPEFRDGQAVFDDMAKFIEFGVGAIEMQRAVAARVPNRIFTVWGGAARLDRGPNAERFKNRLRGFGQGRNGASRCCLPALPRRVVRIQQGDTDAAFGEDRRQRRADHAAAKTQLKKVHHYPAVGLQVCVGLLTMSQVLSLINYVISCLISCFRSLLIHYIHLLKFISSCDNCCNALESKLFLN